MVWERFPVFLFMFSYAREIFFLLISDLFYTMKKKIFNFLLFFFMSRIPILQSQKTKMSKLKIWRLFFEELGSALMMEWFQDCPSNFKMCHDKKNKSYSYRKKVNEQETITMWKKYNDNRWTFNDKNNQQNFKNDHSNYWNFAKDKITL